MGFLENFNVQSIFESASGGEYTAKAGTGWKAASQAAPALLATFQANKARRDYGNKVTEIETFMNNREDIKNPYANITNPFQNLAVATEGARFQAEQADIALANTLDSVRQAGGAGATALAQAALQSKRGVSISIEQQEATNQKLQAQGQFKVDSLKAQGESNRQILQFQRDKNDLDELRNEADQLKAQQIVSRQQAAAGLGATFDALSSGIVPTKIGEGEVDVSSFGIGDMEKRAQAQLQSYDFGIQPISDDDFTFDLNQADMDAYASGGLTPTQLNAGNLSEFYGSGNLPSLQERRDQFITAGLGNSYSGTANQNTSLLEYLQNQ